MPALLNQKACSLCRREGVKLFLKGARCETSKCAVSKRNFQPGAHPWARTRHSEYRLQLREKQKLKRFYGVGERQFTIAYKSAVRMKGNTGENLLSLLERRLDNVVFALGLAISRKGARQLVGHGHVTVNGRRCDIPSAQVRPGDVIGVSQRENVRKLVKSSLEERSSQAMPGWMDRDIGGLSGKVNTLPTRADVTFEVREQLVVELMSK